MAIENLVCPVCEKPASVSVPSGKEIVDLRKSPGGTPLTRLRTATLGKSHSGWKKVSHTDHSFYVKFS